MTGRRLAVAAATLLAALSASPAFAHQGNPNFRSIVHGISPRVPGLSVSVVNYDDHFLLRNETHRRVVVYGYNGDPYVRLLPDGTVQVNHNSPAYYLNEDRFGAVKVPASASATATPDWHTDNKDGAYQWHDHRMHWMGKNLPPQVKDKGKRTRIFNYKIPLRVAGTPVHIAGTLWWQPEPGGGPPLAANIAFGLLALAIIAFTVIVRRRRRREEGAGTPAQEAW